MCDQKNKNARTFANPNSYDTRVKKISALRVNQHALQRQQLREYLSTYAMNDDFYLQFGGERPASHSLPVYLYIPP